MPTQANIVENLGHGWSIDMEIILTRADNVLVNNHWLYPCAEYPKQTFKARYTKDLALSYFYDQHTPKYEEIDKTLYQSLTVKYRDGT
jgi:hypothetical protein